MRVLVTLPRVLSVAVFLIPRLAAAQLRLDQVRGETGSDGTRYTIVTISAGTSTRSVPQVKAAVTLRYAGQLAGPEDNELVKNATGTIGAIVFQPATKVHRAFLLHVSRDVVVCVTDLNASLTALCNGAHRKLNPDDVYVDRVVGRVLWVQSLAYGRARYVLRVEVASDGSLRLLSYHRQPL